MEKIGEFMVRIGAITPEQVEIVLRKQKEQPGRRFGELAIELGYIQHGALDRYIEYKKRFQSPQQGS